MVIFFGFVFIWAEIVCLRASYLLQEEIINQEALAKQIAVQF